MYCEESPDRRPELGNIPQRRALPRAGARWIGGLTAGVLLALLASPHGATVIGSKHDLSSTTQYSDRVCTFCHTPHGANPDVIAPLWNRFVDLNQTFTPYSSGTLDTAPGNPATRISGICLGCHDGTISIVVVNGISGSTKHDLINAPGPGGTPDMTSWPECRRCHGEIYGDPPANWQGTDLSNDHPISMDYPLPAEDPAFNVPPDLANGWPDVVLFDGRVECPTCHDVHDPTIPPFLTTSNAGSLLCLTCHVK